MGAQKQRWDVLSPSQDPAAAPHGRFGNAADVLGLVQVGSWCQCSQRSNSPECWGAWTQLLGCPVLHREVLCPPQAMLHPPRAALHPDGARQRCPVSGVPQGHPPRTQASPTVPSSATPCHVLLLSSACLVLLCPAMHAPAAHACALPQKSLPGMEQTRATGLHFSPGPELALMSSQRHQ